MNSAHIDAAGPMSPAPKRRCSVRTLFVVVAVLGFLLAYEMHWIRQRREATHKWDAFAVNPYSAAAGARPKAPGMLSLFGESGYGFIDVTFPREKGAGPLTMTPAEESEVEHIRQLFPEAAVRGHVVTTWQRETKETPGGATPPDPVP
jgi:hypothetical protein